MDYRNGIPMSWRLAKSLTQLAAEVRARYGPTVIWTVGDNRHCGVPNPTSDHCPNTAPRGIVTAVDIVGRDTAKNVWDIVTASRDVRVKYMIFDGQIVSSHVAPWQPRPYRGDNPHRNHIHISVRPLAGHYDNTDPWLEGNTMTPEQYELLLQLAEDVSDIKRQLGGRNVADDIRRLRISGRAVAQKLDVPVNLAAKPDGTAWIA
jgi:hypothetical protein